MPEEFGSSSSSSYKYSICANYAAKYQQQEIELTGNPYMFTARAYDIETGLYYYRARYYNPYIGRFLQIDPAYEGMNLYAYCGNNPLNCMDPMGLSPYPFSIPITCIRDSIGRAGSLPLDHYFHKRDVLEFLSNAGFFMLCPDVTLESVTLNGNNFDCVFNVPDDACNLNIRTSSVGGVKVLFVDYNQNGNTFRVGLLDERTMDNIIRPTIKEINSWWRWNPLNFKRLMGLDSAFWSEIGGDGLTRFVYKYIIWKPQEINYIVQEHAHKHMRLPAAVSVHLVYLHNYSMLPFFAPLAPGRQTTTFDELIKKLLATAIGYNQYDRRKDW